MYGKKRPFLQGRGSEFERETFCFVQHCQGVNGIVAYLNDTSLGGTQLQLLGVRSMLVSSWNEDMIIPQQHKLMGSSAQISSGVRRCGLQEQVPERGFRRVLV